jgi:hypothetical protein
MFDLAKDKTAEFLDSCKNASKIVKNGVVVGAMTVCAVASQAAVTYDDATKKLTGDFDLTTYESAVPMVIGAVVAIGVVGIAIKFIRRNVG